MKLQPKKSTLSSVEGNKCIKPLTNHLQTAPVKIVECKEMKASDTLL